jgi:hypothetical protein
MDWIVKLCFRSNYLWSFILTLSFILMGPYGWAASNDGGRRIVTDAQRDNLLQLILNMRKITSIPVIPTSIQRIIPHQKKEEGYLSFPLSRLHPPVLGIRPASAPWRISE